MADSFIQVAPDSTGKMMQTYLNTIGSNAVHAEAVSLVDSSGNPITNLNVNVGSSINANFTGTVNVAQSNAALLNATVSQGGTWNITAITGNVAVTGPITNAQLRASEVSVSAASLPLPALASTSTKQSDGTQKTQIVDGAGNVIGSSANSLNVNLLGTATPNVAVLKFQGGAFMANGQVTATNVAATLVAARATRRSVTIRNLDGANIGYIGLPVITSSNGMLFLPQDSMSVDYVGLIQVIMSSGTANFAYLETYD